jgi:hypothetical protein
MTYEIELFGKPIAKKNDKIPFRNKAGKMRFRYGGQAELDSLMVQVPGELRDLKLMHPRIEFFFTVAKRKFDRDNAQTTLLDILVKMGTLAGDSVATCNGSMVIHPAVISDHWFTRILLTEAEDRHAIGEDSPVAKKKGKRGTSSH